MKKRLLAVFLCLCLMLPTMGLSFGQTAYASSNGYLAVDLNYSLNGVCTVDNYAQLFVQETKFSTPIDLTALAGYRTLKDNDLALRLDIFVSGEKEDTDVLLGVSGVGGQIELTSGGTCDKEEIATPNAMALYNAMELNKWNRVEIPLSAFTYTVGSFDPTRLNYFRMYFMYADRDKKKVLGRSMTVKICNTYIVDNSQETPVNDPLGDGTFMPEDPTWEAVTVGEGFNRDEPLVAGYNLQEYVEKHPELLNKNGEVGDYAPIIQSLCEGLNAAGGGTLFIPAGRYPCYTPIVLPTGVTIAGEWQNPDEDPAITGTVLEVHAGHGETGGLAFITMSHSSKLTNLAFWYPEQNYAEPVPYPPTISTHQYTFVDNVTLVNSYFGVRQDTWANCPNVWNVYGTPLRFGLDMDNIIDIMRLNNINFAPDYWIHSGLPGAPADEKAGNELRDTLYTSASGVVLRRIDWSFLRNSYIRGYATALVLDEPSDGENYPKGQCHDNVFEDCAVGVYAVDCKQTMTNMQFLNCANAIVTADFASYGYFQLINSVIEGEHAESAVRNEGGMRISLLNSTVKNGTVSSNNGMYVFTNTVFETAAPQVKLENGTCQAIVLDSVDKNGKPITVENPGLCELIYDKTELDIDPVPVLTDEAMAKQVRKAAKDTVTVSAVDNTGATDVTDALQAELNEVAENGGGVLFLPAGTYKLGITKSITVPGGVELMGACNYGRIPYRCGTVFSVYGTTGRGDGAPTFILESNAGMRGVVFNYPEFFAYDTRKKNNPSAATFYEYPYAIQGRGENVYIINVSFRNAWNGIDLMTYRCDNHYVDYAAGLCLENFIQVGGGAKGGVIRDVQINSNAVSYPLSYGAWEALPIDTEPSNGESDPTKATTNFLDLFYNRTQNNCVAFRVGWVEDQLMYDNMNYGGKYGVQLIEEDGKAADVCLYGQACDYTTVAIDVQAAENLTLVNPQLVAFNQIGEWMQEEMNYIRLNESFDGEVNVYGLHAWGPGVNNAFAVLGGVLNVYSFVEGDDRFLSDGESPPLAAVGKAATLNLVDVQFSRNGVTMEAASARNIHMNGGLYFGLPYNQSAFGTHINMVSKILRWDVPQNATLDQTQKIIFTEDFNRYQTETVGNVANALSKNGSFNMLPTTTQNNSVTLVSGEDGSEMMRLFHNGLAQSVYARSTLLGLKSGRANNLYMLETRLNVKSLRDSNKGNFTVSMYNMNGANPSGAVDLLSFKPDGVYVGEQKLTDKVTDVWYRVQVSFDLTGTTGKTYTVRLLDDGYKVVAEAKDVALPAVCQGNKNDLSVLSFVASASSTDDDKITEVLVDYLFVQQDPTVLADMLGDVDGDEQITSTDARLTLQFYAGKIDEGDLNVAMADVDGDGAITSTDARLILQKYAGKIENFPI